MKTGKWIAVLLAAILCLGSCFTVFAQEMETEPEIDEEGRYVLYINGITEDTDAQIAKFKPLCDGQEVKLSIEGEFDEALRFLKAMDFGALDLSWQFSDFYLPGEETGVDRSLSVVKNLKALTIRDTRYGYYRITDIFEDLEDLTLLCEGESQVFGLISSRQMPSLKHLTIKTDDPGSLGYSSNSYQIFPSTLESIDIYTGEELLPAEEITSAQLIGSLLYCCPDVLINGKQLSELDPQSEGDLSAEEALRLAKTDAAVISILDSAYYGTAEMSGDLPRIEGKLLFAELALYDTFYLYNSSYQPFAEKTWTYTEQATPEEMEATFGSDSGIVEWIPREVPPEILADGLDDADTLVIAYEVQVEMPEGVKFDHCVCVTDLRSGIIYEPYSVNPPGEFDPETGFDTATRQVMQAYGDVVAQAEIGRNRLSTTSSAMAGVTSDDTLQAVLQALNDQTYSDTLKALQDGEEITMGTNSQTAAGLQKTLVDFGCDIAIDGSAGPGTFNALNNVLVAFGMDSAEKVDAELYSQLLPMLLISVNQEAAYDLLYDELSSTGTGNRYDYLYACTLYAKERYYSAREAFGYSLYGDYEERMESCNQPWPQSGELWHNPNYYSQSMYLSFSVNASDESRGMYFEVYSESGDLAAALFLTGSGTVTTSLPGGNYRIKDAIGYEWFGMKEAFGPDGSYSYMTFQDMDYDETLAYLPSGYEWTISINTGSEGGTGVGSQYSSWDSWSGNE